MHFSFLLHEIGGLNLLNGKSREMYERSARRVQGALLETLI